MSKFKVTVVLEADITAEDMEHAEDKMHDFLSELPWPLITSVNLVSNNADD